LTFGYIEVIWKLQEKQIGREQDEVPNSLTKTPKIRKRMSLDHCSFHPWLMWFHKLKFPHVLGRTSSLGTMRKMADSL
jgi:hypothetical protein